MAELALLTAHGVGALVAFLLGVLRSIRALPSIVRRALPREAEAFSLTTEHLGRRQDQLIQVAIVLLVLAGLMMVALAVFVVLSGGG